MSTPPWSAGLSGSRSRPRDRAPPRVPGSVEGWPEGAPPGSRCRASRVRHARGEQLGHHPRDGARGHRRRGRAASPEVLIPATRTEASTSAPAREPVVDREVDPDGPVDRPALPRAPLAAYRAHHAQAGRDRRARPAQREDELPDPRRCRCRGRGRRGGAVGEAQHGEISRRDPARPTWRRRCCRRGEPR